MLDAIHSPTVSDAPCVVAFPGELIADAQQTIATALREYLLVQERAYSAANYCALDRLVDASNDLGDAIDELVATLPPRC